MKRLVPALFALLLIRAGGQAVPAPFPSESGHGTPSPETPPPAATVTPTPASAKKNSAAAAKSQAVIDRLTASNQDLIELLEKQQAVLEDIQYDRRLQNRQITLIEDRLEDALQANAALQAKVARLQAEAAASASRPDTSGPSAAVAPSTATPVPPPSPPASYLPAPEPDGAPGTMWWHRLLAFSGHDSKSSDVFHVSGKQWRVLWHNQDRPGSAYKNTSALFISAFPKGDTIPKKVCSQLGSGGGTTEFTGSGDYYLKVEASGGHWEAAVEDFR